MQKIVNSVYQLKNQPTTYQPTNQPIIELQESDYYDQNNMQTIDDVKKQMGLGFYQKIIFSITYILIFQMNFLVYGLTLFLISQIKNEIIFKMLVYMNIGKVLGLITMLFMDKFSRLNILYPVIPLNLIVGPILLQSNDEIVLSINQIIVGFICEQLITLLRSTYLYENFSSEFIKEQSHILSTTSTGGIFVFLLLKQLFNIQQAFQIMLSIQLIGFIMFFTQCYESIEQLSIYNYRKSENVINSILLLNQDNNKFEAQSSDEYIKKFNMIKVTQFDGIQKKIKTLKKENDYYKDIQSNKIINNNEIISNNNENFMNLYIDQKIIFNKIQTQLLIFQNIFVESKLYLIISMQPKQIENLGLKDSHISEINLISIPIGISMLLVCSWSLDKFRKFDLLMQMNFGIIIIIILCHVGIQFLNINITSKDNEIFYNVNCSDVNYNTNANNYYKSNSFRLNISNYKSFFQCNNLYNQKFTCYNFYGNNQLFKDK